MPTGSLLIADANILVRAVLGRRVLPLLKMYGGTTRFLAPEIALVEAQSHLPAILHRRGIGADTINDLIVEAFHEMVPTLVVPVPHVAYLVYEQEARGRLRGRDEMDWPFVAMALRFDCPIWTEDQDFFGIGIATWTTDRVELFLAADT